jgi:hypothetical protein
MTRFTRNTNENSETRNARSLRHGILSSMLLIRRQLMVQGEWDDPSVLPIPSIVAGLTELGYNVDATLSTKACHEHTIGWTTRQVRKAAKARHALL